MNIMKLDKPITICLKCKRITHTGGGIETCNCIGGIWVMPEGDIPDSWRTVNFVADPVLPENEWRND